MTRYIVIGAGSVGGTIGGALAAAGHDVVLVARGAHLESLQASGLTLVTPSQTLRPSVRSVSGPEALTFTTDDVLILAVKSQDSLPLLRQWSSQPTSVRLPLICAQNGVANEFTALRYFECVYGVCAWLPATLAEPGVIVAEGAPGFGILDIGRVGNPVDCDGSTPDAGALAFAEDFNDAGFAAYATSDIMSWKYGKLLRNLSNAIQAACGRTSSPAAAELTRLAEAEGEAVHRAAGITPINLKAAYAERGDNFHVADIPGRPRGGGSTWQSLKRGLTTVEVDYLNGEIVAMGRLHGIPCPVNEFLRNVVNSLAGSRSQPGGFPPELVLKLATKAHGTDRESDEPPLSGQPALSSAQYEIYSRNVRPRQLPSDPTP
ncbi:ketopantoate reductase family protein [Actinospica robiniae]|uniref:ketopantoate reductase family protein n=1 Tax=Actinospica robiniae TaxID=304901 RepID=UPI0003F5C89D|nr:2-dehydropantoate 2-reductase N-terminal domain-containing protein [Actinospica robiniae]